MGQQDTTLEHGHACLERAAARDDVGLRVIALVYMARAHVAQGRYADSLAGARNVIDCLEGPRSVERFGLPGLPYAAACAQAAGCLGELGDDAGAFQVLNRGQRVADTVEDLYSRMELAQMRGHVLTEGGRATDAIALLEATEATCAEHRLVGLRIDALSYLGRARVADGHPADALRVVARSIALRERANVWVSRPGDHVTLGQAQLALGNLGRADAELARALELAKRLGERGAEGCVRLIEAEVAAARGDRAAAETALDAAQEIAEELGMMRLLERCRRRLRAL